MRFGAARPAIRLGRMQKEFQSKTLEEIPHAGPRNDNETLGSPSVRTIFRGLCPSMHNATLSTDTLPALFMDARKYRSEPCLSSTPYSWIFIIWKFLFCVGILSAVVGGIVAVEWLILRRRGENNLSREEKRLSWATTMILISTEDFIRLRR